MLRVLAICSLLAACSEEICDDICRAQPTWYEGPTMPGRRIEAGVGTLGTRLIVAGGIATSLQEGLSITREVLVFDTLSGKWSSLPDAPVAWTHAAVASIGTKLFLLGGLEGTSFEARGEAFVLDENASEWRAVAPMGPGLERGAAGVVVSPPHVYLLGGASTSGAVGTCLDYDVITSTWSRLPDLPVPRSHPAAMRDPDGTLVVAGGLGDLGSSKPLGDVWALRPGAELWEIRDPMPTPRGGCAYGIVLGQFVCAGGEAGLDALTAVESYDTNFDRWSAQPELPMPRAGARGAAIGNRLYVPGGAARLELTPTNTMLVFGLGKR